MKLASMNMQNLFHRDLSFMKKHRSKNVQGWMEEFQNLLDKSKKDDETLDRLRELSFLLGFSPRCKEPFLTLRRKGGHHYVKAMGSERQPRASERVGWNGWVELRSFPLEEKHRKPKVDCIAKAAQDILVLQEVEDRASLADFNREWIGPKLGSTFDQCLFMEGNDPRGLGHGLLCRNGYSIKAVQPHSNELDGEEGNLFEMDCPEYTVVTPTGEEVVVISARFKEDAETGSHTKRTQQSRMLRSYLERLHDQGRQKVIICGMLGEVAYGKSLSPLLGRRDFKDIAQHPYFNGRREKKAGGRTMASSSGECMAKHDYLLASSELYGKIGGCGLMRLPGIGSSPGKAPPSNIHTVSSPTPPLLWVEVEDV